jgi:MFS transporter, ACS family, hexuronate transporter
MSDRVQSWKWYVCGLLMFATVVNYMDRLALNTLAIQIQQHFHLNNEQYGRIELGFGLAFALGSLLMGWLVDRIGVYWLYPVVLTGWSATGFLTGICDGYGELLVLRSLLGFFESGHFPCGLRVVQILMEVRDRPFANSLMQSGAALGAIMTPKVVELLFEDSPQGWRRPFLVIGAGGIAWVAFWFLSMRPRDLPVAKGEEGEKGRGGERENGRMEEGEKSLDSARPISPSPVLPFSPSSSGSPSSESFLAVVCTKRFLALAIIVVCINLTWQFFRVWLPKFLQEGREYSLNDALSFLTWYYVAADGGVIAAGFVSGWLARHGWSPNAARIWVFAACSVLAAQATAAALAPSGVVLWGALMLVAVGSLGVFGVYYSLLQDLSRTHQGKLSGVLSTLTWVVSATFHPLFGAYLDATKSYDLAVGLLGWLPMLSLIALLTLWRSPEPR